MRAALSFADVWLRFGDDHALRSVTWEVGPGERWAVLGPNGSGKTSLLRLASGLLHPTRGTVEILGHRLGRVDVRRLRQRIGLVSAAVSRLMRPELAAHDAVVTARHAALEPWWHTYTDDDHHRAAGLLAAAGLEGAGARPFGALSEGERQQVLLARCLMQEPELLLFDEPAAGLDLAARERLLLRLADLAADPSTPPVVFITHHIEEVPAAFTHALLLRQGEVVAAGPVGEVLTSELVSACFGLDVVVEAAGGRWAARAAGPVGRRGHGRPEVA